MKRREGPAKSAASGVQTSDGRPGPSAGAAVIDYGMTRVRLEALLLSWLGSNVSDEMCAMFVNFPG